MSPLVQKLLWIFLALAVLLGALWQFYPLPDAQKRMATLPLSGPTFKGENLPLSDFENEFFKGINVVKRLYWINQAWYSVILLDGTHNRHLVHDPSFCFRGAGWTILNERTYPLKHGNANLVTLLKGSERREALYWYGDGKSEFTSTWRYWGQTTLRRLTLGQSGQEPILIIIQPLEISKPDWQKVIANFQPILDV